MLGNHINKNQQYKSYYIVGILMTLFLLAFASNIILNIALGFAADSSNDEIVIYNDNANPDMNYGTKDYWDVYYGPREDKYLTTLSDGQTLKSGDYFIAQDLEVHGVDDGAALKIEGYVNLYFEAKDNQTPGPKLTAIGDTSTGHIGAGAGIRLPEGSVLRVSGRGFIEAQGGDDEWTFAYHKPANAEEGEMSSVDYYGGDGSGGKDGGGGAGSAIGTSGADGGESVSNSEGGHLDWNDEDDNGSDGEDGNDGKSTRSVGSFLISGNVQLKLIAGKTKFMDTLVTPKAGESHVFINRWCAGGGTGGFGGLGWDGVDVGSGGAGAGGGGAGGAGSAIHSTSNRYEGTGGGGGAGASSKSIKNSGGQIIKVEKSSFRSAIKGEDSIGTDIGGNTIWKGGEGARNGSGNLHCGDGGDGGKGGISGSGGIWKSPLISKSENFNYDKYYSVGRKANKVRCFPWTELRPKSLVDWCVALKCENWQVNDLSLYYFPTGNQQLYSNQEFDYMWNDDGEITDLGENDLHINSRKDELGNYIITLDEMDNEYPARYDNNVYKVWLVSNGAVNIDIPEEKCTLPYSGTDVDAEALSTMTFNDQDVKDDIIKEGGIEIDWYKYDILGNKEPCFPPKDVGKYCVQITVKNTHYVGRCIKDIEIINKNVSMLLEGLDSASTYGEGIPSIDVIQKAFIDGEVLLKGVDYYTFVDNMNVDYIKDSGVNPMKINFNEPTPDTLIYVNGTSPTNDNMLITIVAFCIIASVCAITIYIRRKN